MQNLNSCQGSCREMKKLARKFHNEEDENLPLPIHDGDSRPLDPQGTSDRSSSTNYFRLHKIKRFHFVS